MFQLEVVETVTPLRWQSDERPGPLNVVPASRWEKLLWHVPFVGWELQNRRAVALFRPIVEHVNSQLRQRPQPTFQGTEQATKTMSWLCPLIAKHLGWESDRYIPDDPLEIVLFPHRDGIDGIALLLAVEARADCKFPRNELEVFAVCPTLREFVQFITA